jgi:hypothetical protein
MKKILKILSLIGLALTVLPAFFVLYSGMPWKTHAQLMFVGMILWFFTAPFWMKSKTSEM